jgi:hypothetical protein
MSEQVNLDVIEPGMAVYGVDGVEIGPVEAIHPESIRVASHEVPRQAITHVDGEGVHLQVARVAFMAHRDMDVEAASDTGATPGHEPMTPHEVAVTPDAW